MLCKMLHKMLCKLLFQPEMGQVVEVVVNRITA